jgi:uncharacterized protein YndB with AHSA1/START domain
MTEEVQTSGLVERSILIEARPETVFSILSDAERLSGWLDGLATFEPSPGSPFVIRFPQFSTVIEGEVAEVVPNERIAFTWGVSEGPQVEWLPAGSSRVELVLAPEGLATRVTLTHSGLPTEQEVQQHNLGWRFHLSRLSLYANRSHLGETLTSTLEAYFRAWSETDPETRMELLEACCAEDIEVKDEYAAFSGRDLLSEHIGNSLKFVPNATIYQDGEVRICRGEALIPWHVLNTEGEELFKGMNYALVSADGLMQRVVGFWGGDY